MSSVQKAARVLKTQLRASTWMPQQGRRGLSSRWKPQRDSDIFADRAIQEGMRSRAAYKLEEINKRHNQFLQPGAYVVDLGAAPGGFSMVAAKHIRMDDDINRWGSASPAYKESEASETERTMGGVQIPRKYGQLICIDRDSMASIPGAIFIQGDLREASTQTKLRHALASHEADVVLSDMSPDTTGERETNHLRIMELAEHAFDLATDILRNGGTFVCKIFSGADENGFRSLLRRHFVNVRAVRPAATRKVSPEVFYVAQGFVPPHLKASGTPEDVDKTLKRTVDEL